MNRSHYECFPNPNGTRGWIWNPITGSLGDCPNPNAKKLANTRLRERYLANPNTAVKYQTEATIEEYERQRTDPFYPRFWEDRLSEPVNKLRRWGRNKSVFNKQSPKGIFVCDMSDLFGIGIPEEWTRRVLDKLQYAKQHRFYLLTKQPQNLIKFSPFPPNCFVGVSVTDMPMLNTVINTLPFIKAKVKYLSFEPLLSWECPNSELSFVFEDSGISWVILGSQTKPYKPPKIEWIKEIVEACDKAGTPVFIKDNLKPLLTRSGMVKPFFVFDKPDFGSSSIARLRQEMPKLT